MISVRFLYKDIDNSNIKKIETFLLDNNFNKVGKSGFYTYGSLNNTDEIRTIHLIQKMSVENAKLLIVRYNVDVVDNKIETKIDITFVEKKEVQ